MSSSADNGFGEGRTEGEYECQMFSFERSYLKECLKALVEEQIHRQVAGALEDLTEAAGTETGTGTGDRLKAIAERLDRIDRFFCDNAAAPLRAMELQLDRRLSIPEHLLLPQDEGYGQSNLNDLEELRAEVEAARAKALASSAASRILKQELRAARDPVLLQIRAAAAARAAEIPLVTPQLPRLSRLLELHSALPRICHTNSTPRLSTTL